LGDAPGLMRRHTYPLRELVMLVLSRKKDERIVIGKDITVTVVEIRGDRVRLGIIAPRDVPVHCQEVWVQINPGKQLPGAADAELPF
jgi:carbon storage regulator